jgi:GT2 family glycosyltransferase
LDLPDISGEKDLLKKEKTMKYSIIIPACNKFEYTQNCINSIRKFSKDYEIIVIDNGSSYVCDAQYFPVIGDDLKVFAHKERLGFSRAINMGLEKATGDFIVLLNNDTLVAEHWLELMEACCLKNNALVGIAGANMKMMGDTCAHSDFYSWEHNPGKLPVEADYCGMMCLLMTREMYHDIGNLDEEFGLGYAEDAEYGIRAQMKGYRNIVIDIPGFVHIGKVTMTEALGGEANIMEQIKKNWKLLAFRLQLKIYKEQQVFLGVSQLSCMILSWETKDDTILCVESVIREKELMALFGVKMKLIVMDNGSTDGTVEYLKGRAGIDQLILNTANLGISKARNMGIRSMEGKYLYMVDSDITIVKGSFIAMLRYMEEHPEVSNLGAFSWQITQDYSKQTPWLLDIQKPLEGWQSAPGFHTAMTQYGIFRKEIFDTCMFDETGIFGEEGWGYEDNDLAVQMVFAGHRLQRFDDICYYHNQHSSRRNLLKQKKNSNIKGRMQYMHDKWDSKTRATVIVPVFNQWTFTRLMLDSLFNNNDMTGVQVVIVDNGSTDETSQEIQKMVQGGRSITYLRQPSNLGVAKSWNIGLKNAAGKYMIIMNNDILVPKNLINNYITCFEQNPDVYAVNPIHTDFHVPDGYWRKSAEMAVKPNAMITTWGIAGFCFGIRAETVKKIGYFDEQFDMMCYEDRDYMMRMKKANLRSVQLTNVWVHHYRNRTLKTIANRKGIIDGNSVKFQKKWNTPVPPKEIV